MTPSDDRIAAEILRQVARRGPEATICPSEVARALAPDWRPLMPEVRRVAGALRTEGRLSVTQNGRPVDPETARGPIRLRQP